MERNTPQNTLDDLTKQMELIKKERLEDLLAEKQRANKAEDMLKLRQQCDERRIAELGNFLLFTFSLNFVVKIKF